jgi:hypothetical protein
LPSGSDHGGHCRQSAVRPGRLPQCPGTLPRSRVSAARRSATAGVRTAASGVHAGADAGVRTVLRRSGARLTSVAERVALLRHAGRDYRSRCSDGCSVRRSCCQVRLRPSGRLRQYPVSGDTGELRPGVRTRGCPPRKLPQSAGVRCYRKRSPGRRPLVGCSHRRQARRSCRASRSRSCSRT